MNVYQLIVRFATLRVYRFLNNISLIVTYILFIPLFVWIATLEVWRIENMFYLIITVSLIYTSSFAIRYFKSVSIFNIFCLVTSAYFIYTSFFLIRTSPSFSRIEHRQICIFLISRKISKIYSVFQKQRAHCLNDNFLLGIFKTYTYVHIPRDQVFMRANSNEL